MITTRRLGVCLFAVLAALPLGSVVSSPAVAGSLEGLAGWEGDGFGQGYGFVGVGSLKPMGARLTLVTRLSGSYLYYNFESSGTSTSVTSPGVTGMTGMRVTFTKGSLSALGGYETRWEHRRSDLGRQVIVIGGRRVEIVGHLNENNITGGGVLQADADVGLGRQWHGFLFANYAGAARYLFSRMAVRWQATNLEWENPLAFFMGVEGIRQGNDESAAAQGGPFLEWSFVPQRLSVALRGGYKNSWSPNGPHRYSGYAGVNVYHQF